MHIDKRKYAYLTLVENKKKKTRADHSYVALVTSDCEVFMFTEEELNRASMRAFKNQEDITIIDVNYEVIIES